MAYINFKEERVKAKNQLNNRRENNKRIFKELKEMKEISKNYVVDDEFSYKIFENKHWGNKDIVSEEEFIEIGNKDIVCSVFNKCTFRNIKFKNCNFIGCIFNGCEFQSGGVVFENCTLVKEEREKKPTLNKKDNFSCEFIDCNMYIKFLSCNIAFCIFENSFIHDTNFELSDLTSVIIVNSELKAIVIGDSDLTGIKILNTYIVDLEFIDKLKSKLDEKSFIDTIEIRNKNRDEYEGIYMVYETIANKFKENNLTNNFGEYYYLCKTVQRKALKSISRLGSYINYFVCGYGERASYTVYSSLIIIFIFSIIYLLIGVEVDGEIIKYSINSGISFSKVMLDLNEAFNLSIGMFAGVGFNKAQPIPAAYMVSNIEMIIGVIMMGIGVGALVRKIIR